MPCALAMSIWANGISVMASSWPASSAFTWAAESAKSMTVTWSNHGPSGRPPVVLVPDGHALLARREALDLERPGADPLEGALALVADGHDAVEVLAELVGDGGVRLLQHDPHRVGVHLLELVRIDGGEPGSAEEPFLRVQDALDRVDDVVGRRASCRCGTRCRPEATSTCPGIRGRPPPPGRRSRGRSPRCRSAASPSRPIRRVWSGLVTMLWPSMMSLRTAAGDAEAEVAARLGRAAGASSRSSLAGDDESRCSTRTRRGHRRAGLHPRRPAGSCARATAGRRSSGLSGDCLSTSDSLVDFDTSNPTLGAYSAARGCAVNTTPFTLRT